MDMASGSCALRSLLRDDAVLGVRLCNNKNKQTKKKTKTKTNKKKKKNELQSKDKGGKNGKVIKDGNGKKKREARLRLNNTEDKASRGES